MKKILIAGAVLAGCTMAFGAEPTAAELQEQIRALQSDLHQMRAEKAAGNQALQDVQKDAAQRSDFTLMQASGEAPFLAGWDKGKFTIQSADGNFTFAPSFQVQVRNVTNYIQDNPTDPSGDDTWENGFEIRRAKFGFAGKINKDFSYKAGWATNRDLTAGGGSGNVYLEDFQVSYKLNDNWGLTAGQFKDPVWHEESVSSSRQLAADRSLVNEQLGGGQGDRVQGAGVEYTQGAFYAIGVFHDGANSDNRNFRDTPVTNSDWGVSGRVEYLAFGDKKNYGDFSAMKNKKDLLVIGAGADVTGANGANLFYYSVDAQWENTTGLGLYGAVLARTFSPYGDGDETTDVGGLVQAGQMVSDKWEVFGRYGIIDFDGADELNHEITVGANYYMYGHNAKLTLDMVVLPNGSPADTGLGYLNSGEELQVVGRVQFQLAI